jgi:hypothetical protein
MAIKEKVFIKSVKLKLNRQQTIRVVINEIAKEVIIRRKDV